MDIYKSGPIQDPALLNPEWLRAGKNADVCFQFDRRAYEIGTEPNPLFESAYRMEIPMEPRPIDIEDLRQLHKLIGMFLDGDIRTDKKCSGDELFRMQQEYGEDAMCLGGYVIKRRGKF